ncbi:hypothetical protein TNCV_4903671 [Trichonephila clavipes]|uniref:Uncharacterized protein n=1 Tax=Trichonephila clavipes TaxID=2585209 RepID=A0A8X6S9F8_TRICX|nr:hypothetical protein TNCV_4903671 [Trichonephila clavipes]
MDWPIFPVAFSSETKALTTVHLVCPMISISSAKKFHSGVFDMKEPPRSGRHIQIQDDKIKAMIVSKPRYMTLEIAETLRVSPRPPKETGMRKQARYLNSKKFN